MTGLNGNTGRHPYDVTALRRVAGEIVLAGASYRVYAPTAKQMMEMASVDTLSRTEAMAATARTLEKLVPDAPPDILLDLDDQQIGFIIRLASGPGRAAEEYYNRVMERLSPNAPRATTDEDEDTSRETDSGSSVPASPELPAAVSGAS